MDPASQSSYIDVFGTSFSGAIECMKPACVDLNLDNIFTDSAGRLTLIDYEWVYDFAVPLD